MTKLYLSHIALNLSIYLNDVGIRDECFMYGQLSFTNSSLVSSASGVHDHTDGSAPWAKCAQTQHHRDINPREDQQQCRWRRWHTTGLLLPSSPLWEIQLHNTFVLRPLLISLVGPLEGEALWNSRSHHLFSFSVLVIPSPFTSHFQFSFLDR